jgi:glycosyltransferase
VIKVSIIVPTYNSEDFISENLKSLEIQTYKNFEVIFIDACSSDKTLDLIRKSKILNKIIISEPDNGIYEAMNKGLKKASGDWIHILNSDDQYIDENVLTKIITAIQINKNIIASPIEYITRKKNITKTNRRWVPRAPGKLSMYNGWHVPHPGLFVNKMVYEKIGNFNIMIGTAADLEFILRILKTVPHQIKILDHTTVLMRTGGTSDKNITQKFKDLISIQSAYKENKYSKISIFCNILFRYMYKSCHIIIVQIKNIPLCQLFRVSKTTK